MSSAEAELKSLHPHLIQEAEHALEDIPSSLEELHQSIQGGVVSLIGHFYAPEQLIQYLVRSYHFWLHSNGNRDLFPTEEMALWYIRSLRDFVEMSELALLQKKLDVMKLIHLREKVLLGLDAFPRHSEARKAAKRIWVNRLFMALVEAGRNRRVPFHFDGIDQTNNTESAARELADLAVQFWQGVQVASTEAPLSEGLNIDLSWDPLSLKPPGSADPRLDLLPPSLHRLATKPLPEPRPPVETVLNTVEKFLRSRGSDDFEKSIVAIFEHFQRLMQVGEGPSLPSPTDWDQLQFSFFEVFMKELSRRPPSKYFLLLLDKTKILFDYQPEAYLETIKSAVIQEDFGIRRDSWDEVFSGQIFPEEISEEEAFLQLANLFYYLELSSLQKPDDFSKLIRLLENALPDCFEVVHEDLHETLGSLIFGALIAKIRQALWTDMNSQDSVGISDKNLQNTLAELIQFAVERLKTTRELDPIGFEHTEPLFSGTIYKLLKDLEGLNDGKGLHRVQPALVNALHSIWKAHPSSLSEIFNLLNRRDLFYQFFTSRVEQEEEFSEDLVEATLNYMEILLVGAGSFAQLTGENLVKLSSRLQSLKEDFKMEGRQVTPLLILETIRTELRRRDPGLTAGFLPYRGDFDLSKAPEPDSALLHNFSNRLILKLEREEIRRQVNGDHRLANVVQALQSRRGDLRFPGRCAAAIEGLWGREKPGETPTVF